MSKPTRTVLPYLSRYLVGKSRMMPRLISSPVLLTVMVSVTVMEASAWTVILLLKTAMPFGGRTRLRPQTDDQAVKEQQH